MSILGLKKTKKLGFFVALFMFFIVPISAVNAGFFSFIGGLFDRADNVAEIKYSNSQTASILQAAVNFDPNQSKGGGDITIVGDSALLPETGPLGTIADVEDISSESHQISVYVVREGDSLSQIAKMFGVTTNTIIWANDIGRGGLIREGQELVILPVSGLEYTIKKGDTPNSIAKKYGATAEEVLEFNDIDENILTVGDTIIIPNGKKATPKYSSRRTRRIVRGTNVPTYSGYYIKPVKRGKRSQGLHGYNAVDLAALRGTPIVAAASGKVMISRNSGWNGGYGKYIVIEHSNGTQTLYAHNSGNIVKSGWNVVQGQVIGYIGSTGRSTGPHVHFEIRGAKNPF